MVVVKENPFFHHCLNRPEIAFYGLVLLVMDYGSVCFVALDKVGDQHQFLEPALGRPHKVGYPREPIINGSRGNGDVLLHKHLDLPGKRQMGYIFIDDYSPPN